MKFAARRLGIAQQRLRARQRLAAFKSCDCGLAGAHPGSEFGLGEACSQASPQQLRGDLKLRSERLVLRPYLGVGEETRLELLEGDCHVISFARRSASSISARGVLCVFFTNARTTTILRPIAVTY